MVDVSIVNETSGTDRHKGRKAGKPMCREAVPPKIGIQGLTYVGTVL